MYKEWCAQEGFMRSNVSLGQILMKHYGAKKGGNQGDSYAGWYWFRVAPGKREEDSVSNDNISGCSEILHTSDGRRLDGRLSHISRCLISFVQPVFDATVKI